MNNNELYLQYRQAIQLIRVGRFEESLHILQEIDTERPDTKNVLYALAVCCEMLGRNEEALDLCDRLIAKYEHPKARIIKLRIEKALAEPEPPKVDLLANLGLGKPPTLPPPTPPPASTPPTEEDENLPLAVPVSGGESAEKSAKKKSWFFGLGRKT